MKIIGIRIEESWVGRARGVAEAMNSRGGDVLSRSVTASAVMRTAMMRGIEVMERECRAEPEKIEPIPERPPEPKQKPVPKWATRYMEDTIAENTAPEPIAVAHVPVPGKATIPEPISAPKPPVEQIMRPKPRAAAKKGTSEPPCARCGWRHNGQERRCDCSCHQKG